MSKNADLIKRRLVASPEGGPHVLLLAGVHGDEYEPMLAAAELVKDLGGLLTRGSVTVVTVVNENAYENAGRCGDDGYDLARICPGRLDGSISERTAAEVSALIRSADYLVDMHTGGVMYDIAPLAGYMLHPSESILEKQRRMAIAFGLPIVWGTDHTPDGRTLSIARDAGIPAIYLEYGGGTDVRPQVVNAYQKGFINVLHSLGMVGGEKEVLAADGTYWVEDHRPGSGYLQGKMPSPVDGIFVGEAVLGGMVRKGDRWGRVVDPLTGTSKDIIADIDGLAFLRRMLVKVKKGDALGGILPITEPGKTVIYE